MNTIKKDIFNIIIFFLYIKAPGVSWSIESGPASSDRNRQVSNHNTHRGDLRGWRREYTLGRGDRGWRKGLGVCGTIGTARRRCCSPEKSRDGPKREILGAIMTARTQTGRVDIPYYVLRACCTVYKCIHAGRIFCRPKSISILAGRLRVKPPPRPRKGFKVDLYKLQ